MARHGNHEYLDTLNYLIGTNSMVILILYSANSARVLSKLGFII